MANVLVGCPLYGNDIHFNVAKILWTGSSRAHIVEVIKVSSSLLTRNCNMLWSIVLNVRQSTGLNWFAMLHGDVEPEPFWIDTLIGEADKYGADMMSAVVPLKSPVGLTSTAIAMPANRYGHFCRLSQAQVRHPTFPDTFGIDEAADALKQLPDPLAVPNAPREALLVNTGCFVCRVDRSWCERVWFEQVDALTCQNGRWDALSQSEDWAFSRRVSECGGKVMATRLVKTVHHGTYGFASNEVWGQPRE